MVLTSFGLSGYTPFMCSLDALRSPTFILLNLFCKYAFNFIVLKIRMFQNENSKIAVCMRLGSAGDAEVQ